MIICMPVEEDRGIESPIGAHFGSAPVFLLVDTESRACRAIANHDQHHEHGKCRPLDGLLGETLDGIVVGGIGRGALNKLMAAGIPVYRANVSTVAEGVEAFRSGALPRMDPDLACAHHAHGG